METKLKYCTNLISGNNHSHLISSNSGSDVLLSTSFESSHLKEAWSSLLTMKVDVFAGPEEISTSPL